MNTILNPRNIGDIIGDTFRIYGRNFWKLLAITAIVLGVLGVIWDIAGLGLLSLVMTGWPIGTLTGWAIVGVIVLVVANIVGGVLMAGSLIHAVSEQYLRQEISIRQAYSFAWRRLGAMIGAGVLVFLAISGIIAFSVFVATFSWVGWILVVVGACAGIYLGISWIFVFPAALLEGLGPIAVLSRSYSLVKNSWWRVLGITLVVALISGAISAILGIIPVVGSIIGSILVTPIYVNSIEALASELHIEIDSDVT
jgi:hypothetical protein